MNVAKYKDARERFTKTLSEHELSVVIDTDQIKAFWLRKPGTGNMSALIVAGPTGITISGDVSFGDQHALHCDYKPFGWFAKIGLHESYDYLATKFRIARNWDGDEAREMVEFWIEEIQNDAKPDEYGDVDGHATDRLAAMLSAFDVGDCYGLLDALDQIEWSNESDVHDLCTEAFGEPVEAHEHGYTSVALLSVIQETFARLWQGLEAERVPPSWPPHYREGLFPQTMEEAHARRAEKATGGQS